MSFTKGKRVGLFSKLYMCVYRSRFHTYKYIIFEIDWKTQYDNIATSSSCILISVVTEGDTLIECWQAKIRCLHQYLKVWAKNVSGAYKKEKKEILKKLDFWIKR
jgi:hypothetical protein